MALPMIRPPTHDMKMTCPHCGKCHDAVTAVQDKVFYPDDGDASVCFDCGKVSIFDSKGNSGSRKPTADEQRELDADEGLQKAITAWKSFKQQ
jgi:hypothetical protein